MFAMLISAAFFTGAEDKAKAPAVSLDGAWVVLCAEKDGKPMPDAKNLIVVAKGDTITCSGKEGKPALTMKVEFGPKGTIKVSETTGESGDKATAKCGVYVLTQDFLSICVHDADEKNAGEARLGEDGKPANRCTFVLQRSAEKPANKPNP